MPSVHIHIDRIKKNLGQNFNVNEIPSDLVLLAMQRLVDSSLMVGNIPFVKISAVSLTHGGQYVVFELELHDDRPRLTEIKVVPKVEVD